MYQIKATLRSKADPALGSVTIQFPIPWREYDKVLEQLRPLGIGEPIGQDCQVQEINSHYSILKEMEESLVNLDELDYLAKRLESFDVYEARQFQTAAAAKNISSIRDFINLTFCCQQVTMVQDFRAPEQIGKEHVMALNGGCISMEELKSTNFRKRVLELLQNGDGKTTPYGMVYDNGMELRPLYAGGPFPAYGCGEPLVVAFKPREGSEERFLFLPMAESRLRRELERNGVIDPKNLELCYIDQAPMEEIVSSLSLEKEDIFSLNRLAAALEDLSPAEAEKLKAAVYLTEPDHSNKMISLLGKLDRLEMSLRPIEPPVLKLYMPLIASCRDAEYDDVGILDGWELACYEDDITAALKENQMPEEDEQGLMHWYPEEDGVSQKVWSVKITAETRDNQLWGVAVCQITKELTPQELAILKEYLTGQMAGGWGEGMEQRDILLENGHTLYLQLWNHRDWELKTEAERFEPEQKCRREELLCQKM